MQSEDIIVKKPSHIVRRIIIGLGVIIMLIIVILLYSNGKTIISG